MPYTTTDWSAETSRELPPAITAARLQAIDDAIAALSETYAGFDWGTNETTTAPPDIDAEALNKIEMGIGDAHTQLAGKLNIEDAARLYQPAGTYATTQQLGTAVQGLATSNYVDTAVANLASSHDVSQAVAGLASQGYVDNAVAPLASTTDLTNAIENFVTRNALDQDLTGYAQLEGAIFTGEIRGTTARFTTIVADNVTQTGQAEPGITEADARNLFYTQGQVDGFLAGKADATAIANFRTETQVAGQIATAVAPFRNEEQINALITAAVAPFRNENQINALINTAIGNINQPDSGITQDFADQRYLQQDLSDFPTLTSVGDPAQTFTIRGSAINIQEGATAESLRAYIMGQHATAASYDSFQHSIIPENSTTHSLGGNSNRWVNIYGHDAYFERINGTAVSALGGGADWDAVDDNLMPTAAENDNINIGQSGTVATDGTFTGGPRFHDAFLNSLHTQHIGGYPNNYNLEFTIRNISFTGPGNETNANINWDNTTHSGAKPWAAEGYLTGYTETDPVFVAWRDADNPAWASSSHTHEGLGGSEIDLNNLPTILPAGDRAQSLGSQNREWYEVHSQEFYGVSYGAHGNGTVTFGGTNNTTRVRGSSVSLTNVSELSGSAVTAITYDDTALAGRVQALEDADGGITWSSDVTSSIQPAAANDGSYDIGTSDGTIHRRFRDGQFTRNVYAGSFRSQSFRPTATSGSAVGASSTDGAFAEGYIQTLRATNISALAGTTLTVNNATLAGTPVLGAALTGTADLGTSDASLGNAYLTSVVSDNIQPDTSAGSALGANGNRWETIYGVDAVLTQLRGHSEQLTFGTDDTSSQILSANASDTTARTNFHLPGFQFHGTLEASQSNTGTSDYGRIGWLAQSITADSRPWRYGVFRKFVVTDDNTDIYGTDLEDDSAYPPGILLATRIQSSIRRGAGQGRFTDFLEIGVSNTSTDSDSNRRQKLVGWWHIEEKGMRFGDANTPAILHGIQGQIDGSWKFNDDAVIDLNGANATFNNVPAAWTATGSGTAVDWDDIPESIVMRSTLTDGYLGSSGVPWVRLYTPSIRGGGSNVLAIGGAETGNVTIAQTSTTTTIAGAATISGAAQLSSTLNVTGTATFEGSTSGISYNDLDDAPTGGSFTGGTVANDTTFSSAVTVGGTLRTSTIEANGGTGNILTLGGENTDRVVVEDTIELQSTLLAATSIRTDLLNLEADGENPNNNTRMTLMHDRFSAKRAHVGYFEFRNHENQGNIPTWRFQGEITGLEPDEDLVLQGGRRAHDFLPFPDVILGGERTGKVVAHSNLVPNENEALGTAAAPWHTITGLRIISGSDTANLVLGADEDHNIVQVDGTIQVDGTLEANTIISHGTDENLTLETTGTGKLRIEADVAGPESGSIEIDHTNIRETNRMIKIWEHVGAFTSAQGNLTTTYTVNGSTKTVAEMQTLFADAQGVVVKFGAMREDDTSRYHWSAETYWFDNDGMGGHFGGFSDRDVSYRPATTDGVSANASSVGNINFAWDFVGQTFDIHGGDLGAGNRVEIWVRV